MNRYSRWLLPTLLAVGVLGCSDGGDGGAGSVGPAVNAGPVALRRLTAEQYARSIHDVLGEHITVPGRIDPDDRRSGLVSVGSSFAGVTSSGFEKYEAAAAAVAEQALDADHRNDLVPCEPASASSNDDACAAQFIGQVGRRLLRRSLSQDEIDARVDVARNAAQVLGDFYEGLEFALSSLLVSPDFLFRVETAEPDPSDSARLRLTAASVASRLSFLLWNTTPDDELLDAAEDGALLDREVLTEQINRLIAAPQAEIGLRSLFFDVYDFQRFDDGLVNKDATLFPAYSQTLAANAKEQTLRTVVDHLTRGGDYRDLFTTRESFLTRDLGQLYRVPVVSASGFEAHTFDEDSPQVGLLSHASFMSLHSHAGRSSATLRGKFVREVLLCQDVPTPPANIDFSIVEDTTGELRTARERLEAHVLNDACAGCHNLMDPIGLAFENFDATGAFRDQENGVTIDASGELDGVSYEGPAGVAQALRDHPELGPCFVRTLFRYSVGRDATPDEWPLLDFLGDRFTASEFRVSDLVRDIVLSDGFLVTSGPREAEAVEGEE